MYAERKQWPLERVRACLSYAITHPEDHGESHATDRNGASRVGSSIS
jgi:hypothetical protein